MKFTAQDIEERLAKDIDSNQPATPEEKSSKLLGFFQSNTASSTIFGLGAFNKGFSKTAKHENVESSPPRIG